MQNSSSSATVRISFSAEDTTRQNPVASVIVPAYNNQDTIQECIESLLSQEYQPLEVIVVDDGSTDNTAQNVRDLTGRWRDLRLVQAQHGGPSRARNAGKATALGKYILFADGDAKYSPDYLQKAITLMENDHGIGGVCVTGTIWIKKSTFVSRGIALEYEMKQKFLKSGKWRPYFAFCYRKDVLDMTGGFNEALFQSEDKDLFERVKSAGYQIGLVDGFHWFHLYPQDARSLAARSYRAGKQRVAYIFGKKMYRELFKRTVGLWALLAMLVGSFLFFPAFMAMLALLAALYGYKAAQSLVNGQGKGKLFDKLLLPVVSAVRYLSSASGYTKGALLYAIRRSRGLESKWSDL